MSLGRRSARRGRRVFVVAAVVAALLPGLIPFDRLHRHPGGVRHARAAAVVVGAGPLLALTQIRYGALAGAIVAGLLFLLVPRRFRPALALLVAAATSS